MFPEAYVERIADESTEVQGNSDFGDGQEASVFAAVQETPVESSVNNPNEVATQEPNEAGVS